MEERVKIAPFIGSPARMLSDTTIRQNLTDVDSQLATLHAIEKEFDPDIVFTFMNLSIEAQALGLKLDFPEDKTPTVTEHPIQSEESLRELFEHAVPSSMMRTHIEVSRQFKETSCKELGTYLIGPFSLTGILMGMSNAVKNILLRPDLIHKVMELSTEFAITYARELEKSDADYILILEPTAVSLSPHQFRDFVFPYLDGIFSSLKKKTILHICGRSSHLLDEVSKLRDLFGMSLDTHVDLKQAHRRLRKYVIGNISTTLLSQGTLTEIQKAVTDLLNMMKSTDEFILGSGCDLPPDTPLENISHMIMVSREHQQGLSPQAEKEDHRQFSHIVDLSNN
jgi:uroporphyrinogen decarboxylase